MRKNRGITLISLVSSVILILILAGITIVTSVDSYNQMKFEGAKAEIEQVEKLVDEIASDYQTYLTENDGTSGLTYSTYFQSRYNISAADITGKLLSTNQDKAEIIIERYSEISSPSDTMFYFSQDDLNKYFDLKGINDVVINFSTRKVYSVKGIKDPDDKNKLYYISSEWGGNTRVASQSKTPTTVNATFSSTKSGSYYNITVTLDKVIDVSEVYAILGDKTIKRDDFRISKTATNTTIYFTVEAAGTYNFRFVDSSKRVYDVTGKQVNN